MKNKILAFGFVLLLIVSSGCTAKVSEKGVTIKETHPDIRVVNTNTETKFSLSEGYYAVVTYTLTNYGDADGYADIQITGDASGILFAETIHVMVQDSITQRVRVDTSKDDARISVKIISQRKI